MINRKFPTAVIISLFFLISFMTAGAVFAQEHAGHGSMPMPEKSQASKQQVAQPAVPDNANQETPQVEITPEQQQLIGVKTVKVAYKPVMRTIRTVGRVETDERKQTTINTKVEGWIEKLYVDYTGRSVKKGEALAEIYSPELLATQQEFLSVLQWSKQPVESAKRDSSLGALLAKDARAALEAARQRLSLWDVSDDQIRQIEQSGKPLRTLTLYSPVSGYVTQKMAVSGVKVMPGEKLFDISDLSDLWIIADIYEYELPFVKVGQQATVTLSYFPGKEFSSKIDYIYPAISADTRTAKVRLTLANPKTMLKPQMFANVEIKINLGSRLVIPDSAVIDTGKSQVVYVDKGEGVFEPREVALGTRSEGVVEVLRGISAGEKVVSAANFLIDSEAQFKGIKPLGTTK